MGFSRAELEAYRGSTVADLVGPGLRLLFAGINPGLWTAATQTHFNHPGNRFYPALYAAGLIDIVVDRGRAMTDDERQHLVGRGIGITNLVARATARADELTGEELRAGARRLEATVTSLEPAGRRRGRHHRLPRQRSDGRPPSGGCQHETLAGAELWVVPNPSGLNAHATVATLAEAYREAGVAAGIDPLR